jgi:hypothetical protein
MKTWNEAKLEYLSDHLKKPLKNPYLRVKSLSNIEEAIKKHHPELLISDSIFRSFSKSEFADLYAVLKGRRLNDADKSVIHGLYKFSV